MVAKTALTFFEIDVPYCTLTYGVAPCTASLGVTGDQKCFNTRNFTHDCQDPANYNEGKLTLRFGMQGQPFIASMPCLPYLDEVSVRNCEIHPGEDIGIRSEFTASFINAKHSDAGIDKYVSERGYNPFDMGTFWGKFRARNPYIDSVDCRVIRGYLEDMELVTEHFIMSGFVGPDSNGNVIITGQDFLYLLSEKTAQAPKASRGYLSADISAGQTTCTLSPSGIGSEYPSSGKWSIGDELMLFTKVSGDDFTITRAEDGTIAEAHEAEDIAQITLEFDSEKVYDIIYKLITNYSPITVFRLPYPSWQTKIDAYLDSLFSAKIVKPTSVEKLINELIEQVGLVMYANTVTRKLEMDILRPEIPTGKMYSERQMIDFKQASQPKRRYSQVWVFYNQKDVFKNLDEPTNFYSQFVKFPNENLYKTDSIKKIFSRWIPAGAQSIADDVASRAVARYINPPRSFTWGLYAGEDPALGQISQITHPTLEDCFGSQASASAIIIGITSKSDGYGIKAEEIKFDEQEADSVNRTFFIDFNTFNLDLRALYDDAYSSVDITKPVTFIVSSGVIVGSNSTFSSAISSGSWPAGFLPKLVIETGAYVVGKGGNGTLKNGQPGGTALNVTSAITLDSSGTIGGGGGGGGGYETFPAPGSDPIFALGGGGAGATPGSGGNNGTLTDGGSGITIPTVGGGSSGSGGDLGQAGSPSSPAQTTGGAAGIAINGVSLITFTNTGTILGAQVG